MKRSLIFTIALYLIFSISDITAQIVDKSFKPVIKGVPYVQAICIQEDEKIVIGGNISSSGMNPCSSVLRLNPDGSPDNTFNSSIQVGKSLISAIEVDYQKKTLLGSFDCLFDGERKLVRLNTDGTLDISFTLLPIFYSVQNIKALPNGKYLVIGDNQYTNGLTRLHSNGNVDFSFNAYLDQYGLFSGAIGILPDDTYLVAINKTNPNTGYSIGRLVKLKSNGSLDENFQSGTCEDNSYISDIDIQTDGKILVSGYFRSYNGMEFKNIVRLNSNGTIDLSFKPADEIATIINTSSSIDIIVKPDNKIYLSGPSITFGYNTIIRLNPNGTLDDSFNYYQFKSSLSYNAAAKISSIKNRIYIIDHLYSEKAKTLGIAAIDTSGQVVNEFKPYIGGNPEIKKVYRQVDGKIIIAGEFSRIDSFNVSNIARFNKDGSLDTIFTINTQNRFSGIINSIQGLSDTSIIIGGCFSDNFSNNLAKLKPDGSPDLNFRFTSSPVNQLHIDSSDRIMICTYNDFVVLDKNGNLDNSIVMDPSLRAYNIDFQHLAFQQDKKILLSGLICHQYPFGYSCTNALIRLKPDGTLDNEFPHFLDNPPLVNYQISCLAVSKDNRILIGTTGDSGGARMIQLDLKGDTISDGTLVIHDPFGSPRFNYICPTKGNQVIIGGRFQTVNGVEKPMLAKVSLEGDVDEYFKYDMDGPTNYFVMEDSTHMFVVGNFNRIGNEKDLFCIARIEVNFPESPSNLTTNNFGNKSFKSAGVKLTWTDKSENEQGFSIERSTDGKQFYNIAEVGRDVHEYTDNNIVATKKYYYRIKAYNINGGSAYSNISSINDATHANNLPLNDDSYKIWPNPGTGNIEISLNFPVNNNTLLYIYNQEGKCILKKEIAEQIERNKISFNISEEPNGVYFIKIGSGTTSKSFKYIKNVN